MYKCKTKEGVTYYNALGKGSKNLGLNKLNIFVRENKLSFRFYDRIVPNSKILVLNRPEKFCLSHRNGTINLYELSGNKVRNVSQRPIKLQSFVNSIALNKPVLSGYYARNAKIAAINKLIYKWVKSKGIDLPKINCRKISVGTLIQVCCYPRLQKEWRIYMFQHRSSIFPIPKDQKLRRKYKNPNYKGPLNVKTYAG